MIHILLMILKVIGIILLVILALLLTAVLLILFVPVRYRADVLFEGKPDGEAAVSWLLHLVRIRVSYHEHADVSGRVLWFKLFDVRLWPPEDEEEQKTKSETEPVFADFEKTPVLSENDSEIRKTEVSVLTENEQQEKSCNRRRKHQRQCQNSIQHCPEARLRFQHLSCCPYSQEE